MAMLIRKIDYLKTLDIDEVNKIIEQINRSLMELNKIITEHLQGGK